MWSLAVSLLLAASPPQPKLAATGVVSLGAPTRDGRYLTHVRDGNLALRDLASGQDRLLSTKAANSEEFAYFSVPSRDGSVIAYAWFNAEKFYELRTIPAAGGSPRTLFKNSEAGFVQPCAFSSDGSKILTLLFRKDNTSQIALISAATGEVEVLRSLQWVYPKRMDLSPDNRYVVYDSFRPDSKTERALYLLPLDGSPEKLLTPEAGSWLFPIFSADGRKVLYAGGDGDQLDLYERPVGGGSATRLATRLGRAIPLGITDRQELVFGLRDGASEVYVMDRGGKAKRATIGFPGLNSAPVFSPDGHQLAYLSRRGAENYGQESRTVLVRTLNSESERDLAPALAYIDRLAWSPFGLLASGSDGKGRAGAFRIDPASGRTTPLYTAHDGPFRGFPAALIDAENLLYLREGKVWRKQDAQPLRPAVAFAANSKQVAILTPAQKIEILDISTLKTVKEVPCPGCIEIAFASRLVAVTPTQLLEIPLDGSPAIPLPNPQRRTGPVALSPDGQQLAVTISQQRDDIYTLALPRQLEIPLGLDRHLPTPAGNPLTAEKAALGKLLFFDKRLSRDQSTACATCHDPKLAFSDTHPRAVGIRQQTGPRRSPRIANRAWGKSFFWDGRAHTLEEQVLGPIANPLEMDLDPAVAAGRVGLKLEALRDALATYVRTILAGDSPYDRYLAGKQDALTKDQRAGLELFRGKANCSSCHLGPNLTDEELHVTGIGGRIKTPSLRDVARTPPYMHDGSVATLTDVIRFYNEGGRAHPDLDAEMQPLQLSTLEQKQLADFLHALSGEIRDGF